MITDQDANAIHLCTLLITLIGFIAFTVTGGMGNNRAESCILILDGNNVCYGMIGYYFDIISMSVFLTCAVLLGAGLTATRKSFKMNFVGFCVFFGLTSLILMACVSASLGNVCIVAYSLGFGNHPLGCQEYFAEFGGNYILMVTAVVFGWIHTLIWFCYATFEYRVVVKAKSLCV